MFHCMRSVTQTQNSHDQPDGCVQPAGTSRQECNEFAAANNFVPYIEVGNVRKFKYFSLKFFFTVVCSTTKSKTETRNPFNMFALVLIYCFESKE